MQFFYYSSGVLDELPHDVLQDAAALVVCDFWGCVKSGGAGEGLGLLASAAHVDEDLLVGDPVSASISCNFPLD